MSKEGNTMKKLSIFAAAALMLAAVSCNKEVAPIVEPEQDVPAVREISFTAIADNGDDTRTILNGNDVNWTEGETIYVFDGQAPRAFTAKSSGAEVTFKGTAAVASTYTAVSPAATMTGSTINATIPVFQTATAGSFDPKANVSVAVADVGPDTDLDNLELRFKNAAALVKFQLANADVTKVRLDAINGEKLAGKASISVSNRIPTVTMASDAESCVILEPASGTFATGTTYAIAIAPGTYAGGFKLTLIKDGGLYKSFSNKVSQTLERNNIMDFGELEVTGTWKQNTSRYTDDLNYNLIGVTGSSYTVWTNLSCTNDNHSAAKYGGETAGGNNSVQLRSDTSKSIYSGIVSTTSGGKVKSVTVAWNGNTSNGRTLDIYGSNEAYEDASELYGDNIKGTLLGSIEKGTSTKYTVTGDYKYIGIRSNNGAMYLNHIYIEWEAAGGSPVEDPIVETPVFEITEQTPATGFIPATDAEGSFKVNSNVPWNLTVNDEDAVYYELTTNNGITTVSIDFDDLDANTTSKTYTFTVTPFGGTAQTVSFTQSRIPEPELIDLSTMGYTRGQEVSTVEGESFTITFNKGTNTNTPKYYDDSVRIYGGGYFTVTSGYTIGKIEITFGGSDGTNTITSDSGSYSNGVWTGTATSVKFTVGGTSGNRRVKSVKVTFK